MDFEADAMAQAMTEFFAITRVCNEVAGEGVNLLTVFARSDAFGRGF